MFDFPIWVYIGLLAQLLWVAGNLFDKYLIETYFRGEDDEDTGTGTMVLFSAFFALLLSAGIWIIYHDSIAVDPRTAAWGLAIGLLNALWVIAYLHAIGEGELTKTVPVFQTIPVFGFFFSFLLLGETVTSGQFIAATTLIIGSFVLSYNFKDRTMSWGPLFLMLLASATVALQEVIFKSVALDNSFVTSAFWQGIGLGLAGALLYCAVPVYRRQFNGFIKAGNKTIWGVSAVNEFFDNGATLVFSYAIILGPVLLVQAINAYQPIVLLAVSYCIALFFGNYLREDISHASMMQKVIGIAVITAGSVWLYLSI